MSIWVAVVCVVIVLRNAFIIYVIFFESIEFNSCIQFFILIHFKMLLDDIALLFYIAIHKYFRGVFKKIVFAILSILFLFFMHIFFF